MAPSKRDMAYERLRRKIVGCELKPGDLVDEKKETEELGFSRTPVHEAIAKLSEEGLLQIFPRKGVVVSQISLHDFQDILDSRLLIEPFVFLKSLNVLEHQRLEAFRQQMIDRIEQRDTAGDSTDHDFDYAFHMYFAERAGNRYLSGLMATLMTQSQRIRFFSAIAPERTIESYREHVAIIDAALAGDGDAGVEALRAHLINTREGYNRIYHTQEDYFRA